MKSPYRFFVALDIDGKPVAQRSTLRAKTYLSASADGASFSSSRCNGKYPLRVIEVQRPLEWIASAVLANGKKVSRRSQSAPIGNNYVRYLFIDGKHRSEEECWCDLTAKEFEAQIVHGGNARYEVTAFATGSCVLKGWEGVPA